MAKNMRDLVKEGYNKGEYAEVYARKSTKLESFEKYICEEFNSRLKKSSKILDLGCGVGLPYDGYFVKKGHLVTGVDLSEKHIELAKKNVKSAKYILGDFFSNKIKGKYDVIVSFYAIFHIPRTEHKKLFQRMYNLLKKNGYVLIVLGVEAMKYDVNPDFVGAPMAWSSYSVEKNKKLLKEAGFKILMAVEDYRDKGERHLWILAEKI